MFNIIIVTEFKLAVVHFACPNPMQTCACAWINHWTKNDGKSGPGRRVIMGRGPPGRSGPSWAGGPWGRRAAEPLSRRGPLGRGPVFSKTRLHRLFLAKYLGISSWTGCEKVSRKSFVRTKGVSEVGGVVQTRSSAFGC